MNEHYQEALALRSRVEAARVRAERCRRELERHDRLLKKLSVSTAAPAPKRRNARWPYALLALAALALSPRPAPPPARVAAPPPPVVDDDPGAREALALIFDYPDPETGAPMLEVLASVSEPPQVERLDESLYRVAFGAYRFEVDLADTSVRPMSSDSIFAASSRSF